MHPLAGQALIASPPPSTNVEITKSSQCMSGITILPDSAPDMRNITAADRGYGLNRPFSNRLILRTRAQPLEPSS
jgi:hypothetical protein